jgi:secreted trypsin-like serine protease
LTRIVGGETASAATWSWAVSLNIDNTYLCGGSIISSSWVITAAHCVNGYKASKITVYAGSNIRWSGTQSRVASKVIVHPSYNTDTYVNDIALLQLATPLIMTDPYVSSICLPSVSSTILSSGEWPPAGTTVSVHSSSKLILNLCD